MRKPSRAASSLLARGEPLVWLSSAGLVIALLMVVSLVGLVFYNGMTTFWPAHLVRIETTGGDVLVGEVTRHDVFKPESSMVAALNNQERFAAQMEMEKEGGYLQRRLVRTGNFELTNEHFRWIEDFRIKPDGQSVPRWGLVIERLSWGRFYGEPVAYVVDQDVVATEAENIWQLYQDNHDGHHESAPDDHYIRVATSDGAEKDLALTEIVRAYAPNQLNWWQKLRVYSSRWVEFLTAEPREANSEGGVWPALFGTVVMTLAMTLMVVPFGVMAALYLREYAEGGLMISLVRIAINNLAGVPSIVFGVFGLGFFSYFVGGSIDAIFFADQLPNPTFGTGGIMWASLTLALLTLPVVIVTTEEALSAVPTSMREGSFACGATKWQTIQRVVLPRAWPGIMTGAILAMARGAGEVAPLMLVGAVKLAPDLPLDFEFPFVHPERSFMHLGFHIFDLGFQSQNSEAAKPMVFTTTMLLMSIVLFLNTAAIWFRMRLAKKFEGSKF